MVKDVTMYTDGSCIGNPGAGGWGVVLMYNGYEKQMSGSEEHTTNNRMELLAAIKGIEALTQSCVVTLYTDSNYVKSGITQWIDGWKKRGWKTANNKPVKNVDLWKRLDDASQMHRINWQWVRGHSGDAGNKLADKLAHNAACNVV